MLKGGAIYVVKKLCSKPKAKGKAMKLGKDVIKVPIMKNEREI